MGEGKECKIFLCVDCAGYSQISWAQFSLPENIRKH
jgi:hypothetical protein